MYADLDFHSLKDSTQLLQGQEVLLGALVPHEFAQMLPNAWLASAHAGHPFWLFCIKEIIERATACAPASLLGPDAHESRSNALQPRSVAINYLPVAVSKSLSEHLGRSAEAWPVTAPLKAFHHRYCSFGLQSWHCLYGNGKACQRQKAAQGTTCLTSDVTSA